MYYFNNQYAQNLIEDLNNLNKNDLNLIKNFLEEKNLTFASIRELEDGCLEFFKNGDYILLGPCGGVYETKGKYSIYDEENDDGVIDTLTFDIKDILSGNIDVINLGE